MPSSGKARREILQQLFDRLPDSKQTMVDLGSGWGHLVIPLARRFPQHEVIGYELSWFPWLANLTVKYLLRLDNLTLYRRDFLRSDLATASVMVCYLVPQSMHALEQKLKADELEVPLLLSHYFALPSFKSQTVVYLDDWYRTPVYVYERLTT
ncbi:class I SAM-dependent methyltransferase [Aliidiomarina minuta]|nr:class I SAM-dependent methyltransferase [Aliidiomarina minuta]